MRFPLGRSWTALSATLVLACVASPTRGDFLTNLSVDVTQQPDGLFQYAYTLMNQANSSLPAFQLTLSVSTDANLQSLSGPTGWDIIYNPGDGQVEWSSADPSTDLLPGSSGLFSFKSVLGPVLQDYLVAGISDSPPDLQTNSGQIAGPGAAVPEPASIVLCGLGLLTVLGIARFQVRTTT